MEACLSFEVVNDRGKGSADDQQAFQARRSHRISASEKLTTTFINLTLLMKKVITIILLAMAILIGGATAEAKTTKKKSKARTTQSSKGYRIENGRIIPTGTKPVIVDFYTDWCGPCKRYAPNFEYVKSQYGSRATFIRINIDNHPDIAKVYGIYSIPTTTVIYDHGNRYSYRNGYMEIYDLINFISGYLQ